MRKRSGPSEVSQSGEQGGFWPSYTDMMSAVALILFFLMLLAYVENIVTNNDLKGKEQELTDTLAQLALTSQQLESEMLELDVTSAKLEAAKVDLDAQQLQLDVLLLQINAQRATIDEQEALLAQQQQQAQQQQEYLTSTQAELAELRTQMQNVVGFRMSVLDQICENIEQVMGSKDVVSLSSTGSLVFNESVLFDRGKSDLKLASKNVLDQLAIGLTAFLADEENRMYVDTIVIGGHADITGDHQTNWELSTKRANAVLSYLLTTQYSALSAYSEFFSASGYGDTRPVDTANTDEAYAKNRRIEISIILKDDSVMEILDQYLAIQVPDSDTENG